MEPIIPGPAVVVNEFSDAHRKYSAARNSNVTNGITGVHIIVDEESEVVMYEGNGIEGETYRLGDKVNLHYI